MNTNYNQDSFNKGQAFEDFVEKILFPESDYHLLHKTNAFEQNSQRYVGDSRKPDFRFKSKLTGFEFHIEAKYRTNSYKECYDILSEAQVASFPDIHQEKTPIYIALGYGDTAGNPSYVSLIPYEKHRNKQIAVSDAFNYRIAKSSVPSNLIDIPVEKDTEVEEPNISENKIEQAVALRNRWKPIAIILGLLCAVGLISAFLFGSNNVEGDYKETLQARIKTYYSLSDSNNLDQLEKFISPDINFWYGLKEPSINDVLDNIKDYRGKFPFSKSTVDWENLDITQKTDGGYYATYPLKYEVKSKLEDPYREYKLKLITTWDENMKLVSINEFRN